MKELNEEEFARLLAQQLKEDGTGTDIDKDSVIYRELFSVLADDPVGLRNPGLADAVVAQISASEEKADVRKYNLAIAALLVVWILATYFTMNYISPSTLRSAFDFIGVYKWLFAFIILSFVIIQLADKSLVKNKLAGPD